MPSGLHLRARTNGTTRSGCDNAAVLKAHMRGPFARKAQHLEGQALIIDRFKMRLRNMFLTTWMLVIPAVAVAQPLEWHRFGVPETGAYVDLPTSVFTTDVGRPHEGYGRRFTTADGRATLAVQSIPNVANDTPGRFLRKKHPPSDIVYKRVTSDFFVVSSFRKKAIWYDRCNFEGQFINCVMVNYPAREKRQWDSVITRISHSLTQG